MHSSILLALVSCAVALPVPSVLDNPLTGALTATSMTNLEDPVDICIKFCTTGAVLPPIAGMVGLPLPCQSLSSSQLQRVAAALPPDTPIPDGLDFNPIGGAHQRVSRPAFLQDGDGDGNGDDSSSPSSSQPPESQSNPPPRQNAARPQNAPVKAQDSKPSSKPQPKKAAAKPKSSPKLKHKFVRMAKKASYLTELIERHERWKAEGRGGSGHADDDDDAGLDDGMGMPEDDLWDFGTVRHVAPARQATVGRSHVPHIPPTIAENGHTSGSSGDEGPPQRYTAPPPPRRASSGGSAGAGAPSGSRPGSGGVPQRSPSNGSSGSSIASSSTITLKGELPPIPQPQQAQQQQRGKVQEKPLPPPQASPQRRREVEATVRHAAASPRKEPSYGSDEGETEEGYDSAMLDSVILPAIASLVPRVTTLEGKRALADLQRAFMDAERLIPGLANEFVNEIVDSVEHVEEEQ